MSSLQRKAWLFGVAAIAMVVLIGVGSLVTDHLLGSAYGESGRILTILRQLDEIISDLDGGESAVRGYVITGDEHFLDRYNGVDRKVNESLRDLRTETRDDALQQERLRRLDPIVQEKLRRLQEMVQIRRDSGFDTAIRRVRSGRGKQVMDEVRAVLGMMKAEEGRLLRERENRAGTAAAWASGSDALGAATASVLILASILALNAEIRRREIAEKQVSREKAFLEATISSVGDGIMLTDPDGRLRGFNDVATRLLGPTPIGTAREDFPWRRKGRYVDGSEVPIGTRPLDRALRGEEADDVELMYSEIAGQDSPRYVTFTARPVRNALGEILGAVATFRDETPRRQAALERGRLIESLQKALSEVRALSGMLPICAHCKRIRDDRGHWNQIESYIRQHSEAEFSHGICPDCMKEHYAEHMDPAS